jgi:RND family efflux transporter MFP subunit
MKRIQRLARRGVLVLVSGIVLLTACGPGESPEPGSPLDAEGLVILTPAQVGAAGIVTGMARSETVRQIVRVPASVQSPDTARASVGSFVEGRVTRVHVLPGDVVREGAPLVSIHTHELADALRDLAAAESELHFASNVLGRSEQLYDAGAVSLEELERHRADEESARAEVVRAEDILEHLNPSRDGDATIVATRAGTIFSVDVHAGQGVLPGDALMELGTTDVLWAVAFVPEHTATTLFVGDRVDVRFQVPPALVSARLVQMGDFVDPESRSVEVRLELDEIPPGVRVGAFAMAELSGAAPFEGIDVGEDAVVRVGDADMVFVVEGEGRYRPMPVTAVSTGQGRIAVRGVPEGAEIVLEGAYFLKAAWELATAGEEEGAAP